MSAIAVATLTMLLLSLRVDQSQAAEIVTSVYEEQPIGTYVTNVRGVLNVSDRMNNVKFSILSQPNKTEIFKIDETGNITTADIIDREKLCVSVKSCVYSFDVALLPMQYFEIVRVKVDIIDVNDHAPTFPRKQLHITIPENTPVGQTFVLDSAEDDDVGDNSVQSYEIVSDSKEFGLKISEDVFGPQVALVILSPLDREAGTTHQVMDAITYSTYW